MFEDADQELPQLPNKTGERNCPVSGKLGYLRAGGWLAALEISHFLSIFPFLTPKIRHPLWQGVAL
jgi:hypothetical protein